MDKIEIVGTNRCTKDGWFFETEDNSYGICDAIDELLERETRNGESFKITIEKIG